MSAARKNMAAGIWPLTSVQPGKTWYNLLCDLIGGIIREGELNFYIKGDCM